MKGRCPGCGEFHEIEDDLFARFEEIRCVCGRVFTAEQMTALGITCSDDVDGHDGDRVFWDVHGQERQPW